MTNANIRVIFTIGIFWGAGAFLFGLGSTVASPFGSGARQVAQSLALLVFGFLIVLPITIAAVWQPKVAAALLILSFMLFECVVVSIFGLRSFLPVALRQGTPNILLACGYIYAASVRAKARVGGDEGPQ